MNRRSVLAAVITSLCAVMATMLGLRIKPTNKPRGQLTGYSSLDGALFTVTGPKELLYDFYHAYQSHLWPGYMSQLHKPTVYAVTLGLAKQSIEESGSLCVAQDMRSAIGSLYREAVDVAVKSLGVRISSQPIDRQISSSTMTGSHPQG